MKANEVRTGNALELDGTLYVVVKIDHVKPGKGGAFAQMKIKNVSTGQNVEKRFRSAEDVEVVNLDRREIEFLYSDGTGGGVFMDTENYEQYELSGELLGDSLLYCKPNTMVNGLFHNGTCLSLELPASVDLEVTETTPQVKGATATNQLKEATLETGLDTRVPPFITVGEVVRISTVDASYMSRVNE